MRAEIIIIITGLSLYKFHPFLMRFAIFGLIYFGASVDIRPLSDTWVAELLGVILGVHKSQISHEKYDQGTEESVR